MANAPEASMRKACWDNVLTYDEVESLVGVTGVVKSISKSVVYGDFEAAATSDYVDFASSALPANVIVLGWQAVVSDAFAGTGITAATLSLGVSGTTDLYTSSAPSVFTTGTKGSICKTTGVVYNAAAATPRITLSLSGGNCSALTAGAATVTMYYVELS